MNPLLPLGMGLVQGFVHCSAMCGPFVFAFGVYARGRGLRLHLAHHLGRLLSFTLLGAVFGAAGSFVNAAADLTGIQAGVGLAGGLLMVLWAVDELRGGRVGRIVEAHSLLRLPAAARAFRSVVGRRDGRSAWLSGFLLGLHPCGLLYAMLLSSAATGSAARGAATMALFGLGTLPALLAVGFLGGVGRARPRRSSPAAAVLMMASGSLFALRALAVNGWVPAVSPWLF